MFIILRKIKFKLETSETNLRWVFNLEWMYNTKLEPDFRTLEVWFTIWINCGLNLSLWLLKKKKTLKIKKFMTQQPIHYQFNPEFPSIKINGSTLREALGSQVHLTPQMQLQYSIYCQRCWKMIKKYPMPYALSLQESD